MKIPMTDLIIATIGAIILIGAVAFILKTTIDESPCPYPAMVSFILGFIAAICIIAFFKGILPFVHGMRIPFKAFIIFWPMCSVPLVPLVSNIEITGNVIIDAIVVGAGFMLFASIAGTGFWVILNEGHWAKLGQVWIVLSFFVAIIIRAILWALE